MYEQSTFALWGKKNPKSCHGGNGLFTVPGCCRVWREPGELAHGEGDGDRLWRVLLLGGADLVGTEVALNSKNSTAFYRSTVTFSDPQGDKQAQWGLCRRGNERGNMGTWGRKIMLFASAQRSDVFKPGANWHWEWTSEDTGTLSGILTSQWKKIAIFNATVFL